MKESESFLGCGIPQEPALKMHNAPSSEEEVQPTEVHRRLLQKAIKQLQQELTLQSETTTQLAQETLHLRRCWMTLESCQDS